MWHYWIWCNKTKKNCFAFRFFLYRTYSLDILLPSYSSCLSKLRVSSKIMSVFEGEKSKGWKMWQKLPMKTNDTSACLVFSLGFNGRNSLKIRTQMTKQVHTSIISSFRTPQCPLLSHWLLTIKLLNIYRASQTNNPPNRTDPLRVD